MGKSMAKPIKMPLTFIDTHEYKKRSSIGIFTLKKIFIQTPENFFLFWSQLVTNVVANFYLTLSLTLLLNTTLFFLIFSRNLQINLTTDM